MLGREDALAVQGVPGVFEELAHPEVAQQLTHFSGIELWWRGFHGCGHKGGVGPHSGGDFGQRAAAPPLPLMPWHSTQAKVSKSFSPRFDIAGLIESRYCA